MTPYRGVIIPQGDINKVDDTEDINDEGGRELSSPHIKELMSA